MAIRRPQARYYSTACRVRAHRAGSVDPIPERMRNADRWMRRTVSKRPVMANGAPASSTDTSTWTDYATAKASTVGTGLGFALGDGVGCYDLDHCLTNGVLAGWARDFIESVPEPIIFSEVSQSGTGVHLFIEAPEEPGRKIRDGRDIERYTAGRYIAVTGDAFTA